MPSLRPLLAGIHPQRNRANHALSIRPRPDLLGRPPQLAADATWRREEVAVVAEPARRLPEIRGHLMLRPQGLDLLRRRRAHRVLPRCARPCPERTRCTCKLYHIHTTSAPPNGPTPPAHRSLGGTALPRRGWRRLVPPSCASGTRGRA